MNKYLEKIAGNIFADVARKSATTGMARHEATTAHSGLRTSATVSKAVGTQPKVIQNRTGMNRQQLITKAAEMVVNSDTSLPYRRRVEVAIFKGNKVLLTKNKDEKSGDQWYGFPGGGTEGEKDEVAAKKECLEEVGIQVQDLKRTDISHVQEGISAKKGREDKYRGSKTRMFTAVFNAYNDSKLGDDGDAVKYVWKPKDEALALLKDNKVDPSYRISTLKDYWPDLGG